MKAIEKIKAGNIDLSEDEIIELLRIIILVANIMIC